jgi:hypothetical protein
VECALADELQSNEKQNPSTADKSARTHKKKQMITFDEDVALCVNEDLKPTSTRQRAVQQSKQTLMHNVGTVYTHT